MSVRGSSRFVVLAACFVCVGYLLYSARDNEQLKSYAHHWTYGDGDALDLNVDDKPNEHLDFSQPSPPHVHVPNGHDVSHPLGDEGRIDAVDPHLEYPPDDHRDAPGDLDPAVHPTYPSPVSSQHLDLPSFCDYCGPTDKICQRYGPFNLARSRAYEGPNTRLKRVLAKARAGQKIKIGILGGSVTRGHGVSDETNWSTLYGNWWRETFGIDVEVTNGAVPATVSDYYDACFHEHIPEDVDLVVIELAINDQRIEDLAHSYDNLIRGIFELPSKPAIIHNQVLALSFDTITMGGDLHLATAQYYDTPVVSVRNMLLPHVLQTTGENPNDTSVEEYWFTHRWPGGTVFDLRHINVHGHRLMGDLLSSFTERVACEGFKEERAREQTDYKPWLPAPDDFLPVEDVSGEYMPRISMFQKYEPDSFLKPFTPSCMTTSTTKHPLVVEPELSHGFELWSHPQNPDKMFMRATVPGSRAVFKMSTSAVGRIRVTYLRSRDYGLGSVLCWVDDRQPVRLDGWWEYEYFHITQVGIVAEGLPPGEHLVTCELLEDSKDPGKGTDFRITAVDGA